ncbi:MAG TPA: hypothetical protein VFQ44_20455 [Streptosporangiaceae bacterium]|nr:hypothetical protein [Streptosporangiaceae bacterium]
MTARPVIDRSVRLADARLAAPARLAMRGLGAGGSRAPRDDDPQHRGEPERSCCGHPGDQVSQPANPAQTIIATHDIGPIVPMHNDTSSCGRGLAIIRMYGQDRRFGSEIPQTC